MTSGPVQSESLRQLQSSPDATMSHVIEAIGLGEKSLAKDLFSRVSKTILKNCIDSEKQRMGSTYPKLGLMTAEQVELDTTKSLFITRRTLWVRPEEDSAERMTLAAKQLGEEVAQAFGTAKTCVFLVDALLTQIGERDEGFVSFDWKQKYTLT